MAMYLERPAGDGRAGAQRPPDGHLPRPGVGLPAGLRRGREDDVPAARRVPDPAVQGPRAGREAGRHALLPGQPPPGAAQSVRARRSGARGRPAGAGNRPGRRDSVLPVRRAAGRGGRPAHDLRRLPPARRRHLALRAGNLHLEADDGRRAPTWTPSTGSRSASRTFCSSTPRCLRPTSSRTPPATRCRTPCCGARTPPACSTRVRSSRACGRRQHDRAKTEYRLADGTSMPFRPGKVWIHAPAGGLRRELGLSPDAPWAPDGPARPRRSAGAAAGSRPKWERSAGVGIGRQRAEELDVGVVVGDDWPVAGVAA